MHTSLFKRSRVAILFSIGFVFLLLPSHTKLLALNGGDCGKAGGNCEIEQTCIDAAGVSLAVNDCGVGYACCQAGKAPVAAGAASATAGLFDPHGYVDPLSGRTVNQLVARIIGWSLPVIGSLFLVMFIWGGTLWLTAAGEEAKLKKARQTLMNATIGMAIIVGAYVLVSNIITIFGGALGQ